MSMRYSYLYSILLAACAEPYPPFDDLVTGTTRPEATEEATTGEVVGDASTEGPEGWESGGFFPNVPTYGVYADDELIGFTESIPPFVITVYNDSVVFDLNTTTGFVPSRTLYFESFDCDGSPVRWPPMESNYGGRQRIYANGGNTAGTVPPSQLFASVNNILIDEVSATLSVDGTCAEIEPVVLLEVTQLDFHSPVSGISGTFPLPITVELL